MSRLAGHPERLRGLDGPVRSRERAALDIAVATLLELRHRPPEQPQHVSSAAAVALTAVKALVPEAVR